MKKRFGDIKSFTVIYTVTFQITVTGNIITRRVVISDLYSFLIQQGFRVLWFWGGQILRPISFGAIRSRLIQTLSVSLSAVTPQPPTWSAGRAHLSELNVQLLGRQTIGPVGSCNCTSM